MAEDNRRNNVQPPPDYGKQNRGRYEEEYAVELAPEQANIRNEDATSTYGWIGIVLSILSFFVWPLFFGVAGIIFGFVSRNKGADMLGNFAIGIGVVSMLIRLFT